MTLEKRSKPPYLLGLLCLIPLVGAFVGLGLLLYGLLKYKDKWLSIIGAFGIFFTVFVYSSLFYYMKHGDKTGWAELSKSQIKSLIKNIEFYKMQNGQYPDSLQQLYELDKLAPVFDPILTSSQFENSYCNYKRIGDKYTLFSSGIDGIPNTKDDFYPDYYIKDSSKIGLIRIAK